MNPKTTLWCSAVIALAASGWPSREPHWPEPHSRTIADARAIDAVDANVEAQPLCIGSQSWSAGELGRTVLYQSRRVGREIHVGYFVYWSTERPWGGNALSFMLLPALAVDGVYSHFLYVFPGVKDVLYGPGDVEGATVVFTEREDGTLEPVRGVADDGTHRRVELSRNDLRDAHGRLILFTRAWSHQLGEHGGAALADQGKLDLRCFDHGSLRPLTNEVVRAFRLKDEATALRAIPAWPAQEGAPQASPRQFARAL